VTEQVMETVRAVWRDYKIGKIEKWAGVESKDKRRRVKFEVLASIDSNAAPLAYVLMDRLRDEHSARCRRGETFALTVRSMAAAQVIPGWGWHKYDRACKLLLRAPDGSKWYLNALTQQMPASPPNTDFLDILFSGRGPSELY